MNPPIWWQYSRKYDELLDELDKIIDSLGTINEEIPYKKPNIKRTICDKLDKKYDIFKIYDYNKLKFEIENEPKNFQNYIIKRWYNQKIHDLGVILFITRKETKLEFNPYNKEVDFWINDIGFDLKTCNIPLYYSKNYNKEEVIEFLNTPEGRRKFYEQEYENSYRKGIVQNRLFVMYHYDYGEKHWREPRQDFKQFKDKAQNFIDNAFYDEIEFQGEKVKCGIIILSTSDKTNPLMIPNNIQNHYCIA